jgi:predicted transcriptional regulator
LLELVRENGRTCSELAAECGTTRSTVYRLVEPFVQVGFLNRDSGIEFTGAGLVFFDAYENATSVLDGDEIAFLSASPSRISILQALEASPARKAELVRVDGMPSRATIQRAVQAFDERGWISSRGAGVYELTEEGKDAVDAYDRFITVTEQAIEKAPFLRRFGEESTGLPVDALVDTELIDETKGNVHAILDIALDFARGLETSEVSIEAVVPVYSRILFDEYRTLLESGVELRLVLDSETYGRLQQSTSQRDIDTMTNEADAECRVCPESLNFGVGTDGQRVLLVAYGDFRERPVALISVDRSFVEWAENLIEEYWRESSDPAAPSNRGSPGTEAD